MKELAENELDQLLGLYSDLHDDDDPLPQKDIVLRVWEKIQKSNNFSCYGVFVNQQLVSSSCLVLTPNLTRGCRPYAVIENVVTHHQHRRQGYGRQILKHSMDRAWAKNCYKIMLLTGRLTEGMFEFYESAGFDRHSKQAFIAKR